MASEISADKGMTDIFTAAARRRNIAPERAERIKQLIGLSPVKPDGLQRSQSTIYRACSLSGTCDTLATTGSTQPPTGQHSLAHMIRSPSSARRCLLQLASMLGGDTELEEGDDDGGAEVCDGVLEVAGQDMRSFMATRGRSYTFGHGHFLSSTARTSSRRYSTTGQTLLTPFMQRTDSMQSLRSTERGRALRLASVRLTSSPGYDHSPHSSHNGAAEAHGSRPRFGSVASLGRQSRNSLASSHNSRASHTNSQASHAGSRSSCGGSRLPEVFYPGATQPRQYSSLSGGGDSTRSRRMSRAGASSIHADRPFMVPGALPGAGPSVGNRGQDEVSDLLVHPPRTLSIRWADHNLQRVPPLLQRETSQASNPAADALAPLLYSSGTHGVCEIGGPNNLTSAPSLPSTGSWSRPGVWNLLVKKGPSGSQVAPDPAGLLFQAPAQVTGSPSNISLHPSSNAPRSPQVTFTGTTAGWDLASSTHNPSGVWARSAASDSRASHGSQDLPKQQMKLADTRQSSLSHPSSPVTFKAAAGQSWSLLSCFRPAVNRAEAAGDRSGHTPGDEGSRTSRVSWLQSILGPASRPAKQAEGHQGGDRDERRVPAASPNSPSHLATGVLSSPFISKETREMGCIDEGEPVPATSSRPESVCEPTALHVLQAKLRAEREQREPTALTCAGAVPALDRNQSGRSSEGVGPGGRAWKASRLMVRSQPGGET